MNAEQLIRENEKRRARLSVTYDPVSGIGSLVPRVPVRIHDDLEVHVPEPMLESSAVRAILKAGSLGALAQKAGKTWRDLFPDWHLTRIRYDYEYWCATCAHIETNGEIKPLILNAPQRKSLAVRERQRVARKPIRQIELKHRQYGSTTEKNAYIAWFQNVLKERWNAYVISLDADAATEIVARYDTIAAHYPPGVGTITLEGYYGARNTKLIRERDCFLAIGSAKAPNAPSGRSIQMALISEAGKMGSTAAQGAEKLITNIASMVQLVPDSVLLVESTADNSGAWFKNEVQKAQQGRSSFEFTFISWLDDYERCVVPLDGLDVHEWIRQWGDYDWYLWGLGATLEQIHWYRRKSLDYPAQHLMQQENPTTAEEAFAVGENRVFQPKYVAALRKTCKPPVAVGRLVSDAEMGEGALSNIRFEPDPKGPLSIWRFPGDRLGGLLEDYQISNRYAVASDVGGLWSGADFSNSVVGDRAPRLIGSMMEVVAEYHAHVPADVYAWDIARLSMWYDEALWWLEVNSMRARLREQRADFGMAVLEEIKHAYPRLWHREVFDATVQQLVRKAGWVTDKHSKGIAIKALDKALRTVYRSTVENEDVPLDAGLVERVMEATNEMDTYLDVEGSMEAAEGKKDDRVITRAILCHADQSMPAPEYIRPATIKRRKPSAAIL